MYYYNDSLNTVKIDVPPAKLELTRLECSNPVPESLNDSQSMRLSLRSPVSNRDHELLSCGQVYKGVRLPVIHVLQIWK